ncbi:flavodoxin-dependent (E)-4-hydroxy-3-methylbut-2-enyl-diphosphate synthase [bacterium]|nr:flavodoxin-dependent (E)-4-hydroxy-3-methylbut-2-enyl-diphosphate synthase [FCB group bacterium]MBL7190856.1 flavodoxin-dependent (E)-4-hydroxy-3-methylbut-2-enyl-diphosphate synthase [bacterium]
MIERRKSRLVKAGNVRIGGGAPVVLQSMTNTLTTDAGGTIRQINDLMRAGCDLVRVAVPDFDSVVTFGQIRKAVGVPLIADIHFDYKLAIAAIENGADKIRINPGNIGGFDRVRKILRAAEKYNIPIRIGVNAGSLEKNLRLSKGVSVEAMLESCLKQVKAVEDEGFRNIVLSIKTSSIPAAIEVNRLAAKETDYPLHLGLTEAGLPEDGSVKSAVALGILLAEGIGDTIRVSLTGDPLNEIRTGLTILRVLGLKPPGLDIISCPTCARTHGPVEDTARRLQCELAGINKPLKIAVMGCEVNGPGEAREADIGLAFSKNGGIIFRKGEILGRLKNPLEDFMKEVKKLI